MSDTAFISTIVVAYFLNDILLDECLILSFDLLFAWHLGQVDTGLSTGCPFIFLFSRLYCCENLLLWPRFNYFLTEDTSNLIVYLLCALIISLLEKEECHQFLTLNS